MILFPCVVTFQNGAIRTACKVWTEPTGTDVLAWNRETNSVERLAHGLGQVRTVDRDVYELDVEDGTSVRIVIDPRNCGCGHPLKYYNPKRASVGPV